jgi:hypothetical protein
LCDAINPSIHTPLFLLLCAINGPQQKVTPPSRSGTKQKRESRERYDLFDPFFTFLNLEIIGRYVFFFSSRSRM